MSGAITPRLELRQQQSLVMTQQLQQSIKLLQLSALELREFVAEELEKNPLLQEDSREEESEAAPREEAETASKNEDDSLDIAPDDSWNSGDWQDKRMTSASANGDSQGSVIEQTVSELPSLRDHLLEHLLFACDDIADRLIGRHLIDLVDEAGYLTSDYANVADTLQCAPERVERVVGILQQCGPAGLCARNIAESLSLQLREKDRFDPAMEVLIAHLDLLARADFDKLTDLCGVDREDLKEMIAEIKLLNPKPGLLFGYDNAPVVEPDVLVKRIRGGWHIELNSRALPKVLVNQPYYVDLSEHSRKREEKKYINDLLANANWLVKALDQRANTLLKVAREIVSHQENFLKHGLQYLKPLTLREVAEAVEVHESTVSRITTQKYMLTPTGMYELKYFFTSSIQGADGGESVSSKAVQFRIKKLIEEEGEAVLSDDAIAEELKNQGINVARRTVAKYRDIMGIPSSSDRKRQNKSWW